ncbi:MAG: signal peptidase II [Simkania sp.]|nr:signal peptidase II [Simkania sp.]
MRTKRSALYILICAVIFCLDRYVKYYINAEIFPVSSLYPFYPYGGVGVFENWCGGIDFSINHVTNTGAAWGFLSAFQQILLWLRMILIGGIAIYLFCFNTLKERELPFALILTGAIGNVIDHFVYGHVIDMFHFNFWGFSFAVFNIADAAIFCGVTFIVLRPAFEKSWQGLRGLLGRS